MNRPLSIVTNLPDGCTLRPATPGTTLHKPNAAHIKIDLYINLFIT